MTTDRTTHGPRSVWARSARAAHRGGRGRVGSNRPRKAPAFVQGARKRLEALRREAGGAPSGGVTVGRFRFHVPRSFWAGELSAHHPRIRIEILNRGEITPHASVSDCWISGGPPGTWVSEIARLPGVLKVESLSEMGGGSLYRVSFRNPPLVYFFRSLRAPIPFPIWIQSGIGGIEIVTRRREFEAFKRFAREVDPAVHVESVRRGPLRSHLPALTSLQHALLANALASGYFAVPRKVSLTELARRLNRGPSGLSRAIADIERKLLESALSSTTIHP